MPIFLKKKESKEKALKESNKIWRKAKIFEGKQKFLKGSKKKNAGKQKNIWRKAIKNIWRKAIKNIWRKAIKSFWRKAKNIWISIEGKQTHLKESEKKL